MNNTCSHCFRPFKHKMIFDKIDKSFIEVIDMCRLCRAAFRRKKQLETALLENEWNIFGLRHHRDYFDDN